MPGLGKNQVNAQYDEDGNPLTVMGIVRTFLLERKKAVREDPSIKEYDPLSLSTIWYRLRKRIRKFYGAEEDKDLPKRTRNMVQVDYVNDIFDEPAFEGLTRADLGIAVGKKAMMYYAGEEHILYPSTVERLAKKGIGMIAIEKDGVAKPFSRFYNDRAIAVMTSGGFFTENARDYCKAAKEYLNDTNAGMVRDFDSAGLEICFKSGLVSLGVDPEMVEEIRALQREDGVPETKLLTINDVEEEYNGTAGGHWQWIDENLDEDDPNRKHLEYLKTKRIEIDLIVAEVGLEMLWRAVHARLIQAFPEWDYTKVINTDSLFEGPEASTLSFDYDSTVVDKLNGHMESVTEGIEEDKASEFTQELEEYSDLVDDVEDLRITKKEEFIEACQEENEESADICSKCEPILKELEEEIDEKTTEQQNTISDIEDDIENLEKQKEEIENEITNIATEIITQAEIDKIIPAIKELDEEKGYNIVEDAGLEEEEEKDDDETDE